MSLLVKLAGMPECQEGRLWPSPLLLWHLCESVWIRGGLGAKGDQAVPLVSCLSGIRNILAVEAVVVHKVCLLPSPWDRQCQAGVG